MVIQSLRPKCRGFGTTKNGKQQRGENGNDRDDHQQLDERESSEALIHRGRLMIHF